MTKLSVYGGTGFVGGNFSRMYPDDTIVIPRDQREPESDEILYLISTVDNYNVHTNITLDVETNLKVLCETLDKCRDLDVTFNFISSWFVYGDIPLPAREDSHCKPTGFYSITKRAAEDLVMSFCNTYGKNYRILRLANVMGAGDGKTSAKKNALAFMVDKMKKDTTKKQQVDMLLNLGLTKKQIKSLKYENARVKKIIELQNKKKDGKNKS